MFIKLTVVELVEVSITSDGRVPISKRRKDGFTSPRHLPLHYSETKPISPIDESARERERESRSRRRVK